MKRYKKDSKPKKTGIRAGRKGRRIFSPGGLALLGVFVLALAALGLYALFRPRPLWYVEAPYGALWRQVLAASSLPRSWRQVQVYEDGPDRKLPAARYYGYQITAKGGDGKTEAGISGLYPLLAQDGEYQGALVLAADPWMVFRKNTDPPLSRERAEGAGEGTLYLAGRDDTALAAWTAQLLQERPGTFPPAGEAWIGAAEDLFQRGRFQQGAQTYSWEDIWFRLFNPAPAWVYAPLSVVQRLPGYRTSLLEADRFPEKTDWNEFGLQARMLWAVPFGREGKSPARIKKIDDTSAPALIWLRRAATRTALADALGWIPAHREGVPYNPIARSAWLAWLGSSFIWDAALPPGAGD